jgi:succinyl-CoA synthetase beta subunit
LNLHEYQAQKIFSQFGVSVPQNMAVFSVKEAAEKANEFPGDEVVVKSQVLAGGRGLGYFKENNFQGGVHIVAPTPVGMEPLVKYHSSLSLALTLDRPGDRVC